MLFRSVNESFGKLIAFSHKRLLEDHVPYVVEAYPENNMRHLSAESALYCRIFIEGLLGFEQTGFKSFEITPRMPDGFEDYSIEKIHFAGTEISIKLNREGDNIRLNIYNKGVLFVDKSVKQGQKTFVKI